MIRAFAIAVSCACTLVAVAIAPGGALANVQFQGTSYPLIVKAESAKGVLWMETEAGQVTCATTFQGQLSGSNVELSLAPTYTGCTAFGFAEATVKPEGCVWKLSATEVVAEDEYAAHAELSCPAGQSLKVMAGSCAAEFKPQTGLTTVSLVNDLAASPDRIQFTPLVSGLQYVVTSDGFGCAFNGTGTKNGGLLTSSQPLTMRGEWAGPVGIKLGGTESSSPTAEFEAGAYPASAHGSGSLGAFQLETEAGSLDCGGDFFFGGKLSAASSQISFGYAGLSCSAFGFESATVKAEECRFAINARSELAADEFDAYVSLICPAGKSIKITAGTCSVELKSQWMLKTVEIVNDTAATPYPIVTVTPEVTGLQYLITQDGLGCPFAGTGMRSSGKINGSEPLTFTAEKTGLSVAG
jgi:hypothetical protein